MGETAVVAVTADTTAYERSMGATVAPAQKAASSASAAFSSEFNKISSGAAALAAGLGGPLGKVGSIANSALKPLTEVASSIGGIGGSLAMLGGAAGLAVGALGGIGLAAKGLADGAVEAADRLEEIGIVVSNRGEIDAYAHASIRDLGIAMDELSVAVGGQIAEDLTRVVEAAAAGVRAFIVALAEHSDGSRYLNFAGFQEEGESMMRRGYGPHYDRLAELKRKYNPDNVFQLNPNVSPA